MTDRNQIALMLGTGVPENLVAERLECSLRTVRRVKKDRAIDVEINPLIGTDREKELWQLHYLAGVSERSIARLFGQPYQRIIGYFKRGDVQRLMESKRKDSTRFFHFARSPLNS